MGVNQQLQHSIYFSIESDELSLDARHSLAAGHILYNWRQSQDVMIKRSTHL
jgi:hypothetical protein